MTLSVRLDSKTTTLVNRMAKRRRQSKSAVVREAIGVLAAQEKPPEKKKRPYDLVKHLIGCVRGGPRDLSKRTGDKFYQLLIADTEKRR